MADMLTDLSGGKLLVILEGGFVAHFLVLLSHIIFPSSAELDWIMFSLAVTIYVQYHLLLLQ